MDVVQIPPTPGLLPRNVPRRPHSLVHWRRQRRPSGRALGAWHSITRGARGIVLHALSPMSINVSFFGEKGNQGIHEALGVWHSITNRGGCTGHGAVCVEAHQWDDPKNCGRQIEFF